MHAREQSSARKKGRAENNHKNAVHLRIYNFVKQITYSYTKRSQQRNTLTRMRNIYMIRSFVRLFASVWFETMAAESESRQACTWIYYYASLNLFNNALLVVCKCVFAKRNSCSSLFLPCMLKCLIECLHKHVRRNIYNDPISFKGILHDINASHHRRH